MSKNKLELSTTERIMLSNQYKILEKLYDNEAIDLQRKRKIVECGFELEYHQLNNRISDSQILTENECREIIEILQMFSALENSYNNLSAGEKNEIDLERIQYKGFDGNHECKQGDYADFCILMKNRGHENTDEIPGLHYNSHIPMISVYRRMLTKWKELRELEKNVHLFKKDILSIAYERIHPSTSRL